MKQAFLFILLSTFLLFACEKKKGLYTCGEPVKTQLDESKIVLSSIPKCLTLINDSTAAMVCNRQTLLLCDLQTGRNVNSFSPGNIHMDSLLDATYNLYYKGKRTYLFDSTNTEGLEGSVFQMTNFNYHEGKYYVYLNSEVEVKYQNDSASVNQNTSDPQVKAALQKYPSADFHFMEYVQFIFVLDKDLQLIHIDPLYTPDSIAVDYSYAYQLGFGVFRDHFYVPLLPTHWTTSNYRSKVNDNGFFYSIAKQNMNITDSANLMFSNKEMNYTDFSFVNYLDAKRTFHSSGNTCYFCNGKEIWSLATNESVMKGTIVQPNEWITDFFMNDEKIFLKTFTFSPKVHPTKLDVAYATDSISADNIIVVNREEGSKEYLPLQVKGAGSFALNGNKLTYIERDKEHYYVTKIPIEYK